MRWLKGVICTVQAKSSFAYYQLFGSWRKGEGPKGTSGFDCTWGPKCRKPLGTLGNKNIGA